MTFSVAIGQNLNCNILVENPGYLLYKNRVNLNKFHMAFRIPHSTTPPSEYLSFTVKLILSNGMESVVANQKLQLVLIRN